MLARLAAPRGHWPVGTLQLTITTACCAADANAAVSAARLAVWCAEMEAGLESLGVDGVAPFILFSMTDAKLVRKSLQNNGSTIYLYDRFLDLG